MASVPASKGLVQFVNIFDIAWECEKNVTVYVTPKPQRNSFVNIISASATLFV